MQPTTFARSADGTRLAVYDSGGDAPVVVCVHGYPDNAAVWDGLAGELAGSFRVVRYDVRGCGNSGQPEGRSAYRVERLVADLAAVLDAVSPARPVHLVGHDWGSVQSWPALTDARTRPRIADFASISGPSLDHVAAWARRDGLRQPWLALTQAARSSYVAFFQLPWLPELLVSRRATERAVDRLGGTRDAGPTRRPGDFRHGLELYRANVLSSLGRAKPTPIDVPVLVLLMQADQFLDPRLCSQAPRPWVADLATRSLPGGHWMIVQRPDEIARCLTDFWGTREPR